MRNNLHDDPKTVWQNQPTETSKVNLILIRQKARELHAKTRRQLLGSLAAPFAVAFFYAFCIKQFPYLREVVHALFALALAWSIVGLYFLNQGKWQGAMPGDAGFSTGLEFCRREIERRRSYFRRDLLWVFGPVLLAIGTFIMALALTAGTTIFPKAMPFMVLVVVWIAVYLLIRVRQQRDLQRELDELGEINSENSQ
jgi:multisubunit Na+/H+ antiporter MnhG subunit